MFRRKARSDIELRLETGLNLGDVAAFKPGERITGEAVIRPENDVQAEAIRVKLIWYTEGRGDRDSAEIDVQESPGRMLTQGSPVYVNFNFSAPMEPWSYAGTLINIVWAIEVEIDPARGRSYSAQQPIVISPFLERISPPPERGF